jgi:ATP-dependent RNA circularization protein (DNA/RNA ligase family)
MSKYGRTYHLNWSPGATSDDKISDSIESLIENEIVITEKLDGENTGMTNDGVYARSHADFTTSAWTREVRQLHDVKVRGNLSEGVFLFGEGMEAIHSIEYKKLKSYFYIFGVRDNNIWIPWESVEEYSYLLDIPTVPVLFKGVINSEVELKDIVDKLVSEPSELGGEREGIVVRNAGLFHNDDFKENVMKWVRYGHVKTDEHWTRNWKRSKINY